jgi:hypothetical protein
MRYQEWTRTVSLPQIKSRDNFFFWNGTFVLFIYFELWHFCFKKYGVMTNWCMDQRMESVYLHAKGRREKRGRISVTFRGASAFFRLCLMGGVASHSQSGANELKSLSALIIRVGLPLSPARYTCCPGPLRMNHSECSMNVHVARIIMASSRTHGSLSYFNFLFL